MNIKTKYEKQVQSTPSITIAPSPDGQGASNTSLP